MWFHPVTHLTLWWPSNLYHTFTPGSQIRHKSSPTFHFNQVKEFEQGLGSILTDSIETPELAATFHESFAMTSSVPSGFLQSVIIFNPSSSIQILGSLSVCWKTSYWMLLIWRLIRFCHIFRLALVQLCMQLQIQSSLFYISEVQLVILFPPNRVLKWEVTPALVVYELPRFTTFWMGLFV